MKNDLLQQLDLAHERMVSAVKHLPEQEKITKDWTKKELLAHIAGWYEEGVNALPKILRGEKPESFRFSINGFNKRSVKKRKSKSFAEILEETISLNKQFVKQIRNLEEKQITEFYGTRLGKKPINLLWMINEAISHDTNHAKEIEKNISI